MENTHAWFGPLTRIDEYRWEIPQGYRPGMHVPGKVFASEKMMESIKMDQSLEQVANVAHLPGIVGASMAMPDIHWGYGFPIGGVAAFDMDHGVISPGGVGYDINCGIRLYRSSMERGDVVARMEELLGVLMEVVPSGLGSSVKSGLSARELRDVITMGASWVDTAETDVIESRGCMAGANPDKLSERALKRGQNQLGTLGSGNHFLEVGAVEEIFDAEAAKVMGLEIGQVTIMVHTGSRGLGYQTCDDYVGKLRKVDCGIKLPDRELCCAPLTSNEGHDYMAAMACAANFGFANRHRIGANLKVALQKVFNRKEADNVRLIYDVSHNIAKIEIHGTETLCVHRKGATRAFPPGHREVPRQYREIGQPVLIPGDMGRYSYVAMGAQGSSETFGSICHGAGRVLSRGAAKRTLNAEALVKGMKSRGILVRTPSSLKSLVEEASEAYKDVAEVVSVVEGAGLARMVAKLVPLGVVKG